MPDDLNVHTPIETESSESSVRTKPASLRFLLKLVQGVGWILLFGITLDRLGTFASERLVKPNNQEGYGMLLGLGGVFLFMPLGLLISFVVLGVSKRIWLFFAMAVGLAAVIAFGAALM